MLKDAPPDLDFITYCGSDFILNYFLFGNTLKYFLIFFLASIHQNNLKTKKKHKFIFIFIYGIHFFIT